MGSPLIQELQELLVFIPRFCIVLRSHQPQAHVDGVACHAAVLAVHVQVHHEALHQLIHLHLSLQEPQEFVYCCRHSKCCVAGTEQLPSISENWVKDGVWSVSGCVWVCLDDVWVCLDDVWVSLANVFGV